MASLVYYVMCVTIIAKQTQRILAFCSERSRTLYDNGKPVERQGRKATGPSLPDGSQLPKGVLWMMRKWIPLVVAITFLFSWGSDSKVVGAEDSRWLDTDNLDKGAIRIDYDVKPNIKTKLLIVKGQSKYNYNLTPGKSGESFALQLGNGEYTISLLEQINGSKYREINKDTLQLDLADENQVYLNSIQNVDWDIDSLAVKKAKELTKNATTDYEKVKAIYQYMISNIKYDNKLAFSAASSYLPEIDRTLSAKKDICYGFSSLYAAMLRSEGIPAKLVMGKSDYVSTYHAWNEVFVDNKWVIIDTTVDAGWKGTTTKFTMIKDATKYQVDKFY